MAERFELYVAGVELCNGFGELTDAVEQRARLEHDQWERQRRGLPVYPIDERFVESVERMPPTGGMGIGMDRLTMLLTGQDSIREVILFPTMREQS